MKGIVLAGGTGSRLMPLTKSISKHILPIYNQPMVYFPIQTLVKAGITDIILVAGGNHMSQYIDLLGDGSDLNCKITFVCQMKAGGISEALSLTESHIGNDDVCVILGDNIFEDDISEFVEAFREKQYTESKCWVVCKEVEHPEHYGVLEEDDDGRISIVEKPKQPKSKYCVTGLYMYTSDVFDRIRTLDYSERGELEVTDLNNSYAIDKSLHYSVIQGKWWDCGVNIDHMLQVANEVKEMLEGKK